MSRKGRDQAGRSPVSRLNMQSYNLTDYELIKRETQIAMGRSRGGHYLISASAVTHRGRVGQGAGGGGVRFDHPRRLTEVVPNC